MSFKQFTEWAIIGILSLCVVYLFNVRVVETRYIEKPYKVPISSHELDSLRLAISLEVKGQLKPKIIVVEDTSRIHDLLDELMELRDSLHGKAELSLEYSNDTLGVYRDSIRVKAEFIDSTMSVVFKPTKREYETIRLDTVFVKNPAPFWRYVEDAGLLLVGAVLGRMTK
jgi:hypothetical protein